MARKGHFVSTHRTLRRTGRPRPRPTECWTGEGAPRSMESSAHAYQASVHRNQRLRQGSRRQQEADKYRPGLTMASSPPVYSRWPNCPRPAALLRGLEQPFFSLFLALYAVARPGHGFETLGVDLFPAGDAFSEAAFANAGERSIHHVEQLAVVVALAKEKLLVVGAGGAVGNVLCSLVVRGATVLLIAYNHVAQLLAPGFQPFSERL